MVSVATLPVMVSRLGWGSRFKSDPRLNAAGSLVTPYGTLESGRMGNTSPATEPLRGPTQPLTDELRVRQDIAPGYTPSRLIWEANKAGLGNMRVISHVCETLVDSFFISCFHMIFPFLILKGKS